MEAIAVHPERVAQLAPLFQYPGEAAGAACACVAEALRPEHPRAASAIDAFLAATAESDERAEDAYTRAFDLGPQAPPYLSVYLFGAESHKRSELMTGLLDAYARCGFDRGGELPDHIAVVLAAAPCLPAGEWDELAAYCLSGPLKAMHKALHDARNPYAHVVRAAQELLRTGEIPS